MKYIELEEIELGKFNSVIKDLSGDSVKILDEYELYAIDLITSYLYGKYDTDYIFSLTGTKRSPILKRIIIDLMICQLFGRINTTEIPENILLRCSEAKKWLVDVSKGIASVNLPKLDPIYQANTNFKYGSEPRFNNIDSI